MASHMATVHMLMATAFWLPQEDDVIGVLTSTDKIAELTPLGDRILIKVRVVAPCHACACARACGLHGHEP